MIPDNPNVKEILPGMENLIGKFLPADNMPTLSELEDYELGGVGIQDPSQGLQVKLWKCWWDENDDNVYLEDTTTGNTTTLFNEVDIVELAFTFDQNMRWYTATRHSDNTLNFRWFDTQQAVYELTSYANIKSARLAHDDKRRLSVEQGQSDVILTYLRGTQVHWRIQRDRFAQEYTHPTTFLNSNKITHFGMSTKNRLQWRLGTRRLPA